MREQKEKKLTPKQAAFVAEYLVDLNATKAATRAGYSEKTAYSIGGELLKKPEIQQAISEARADQEKRTQVDADFVVNGLVDVYKRCMVAEPVLDSEGNNTGVWRFSASGANKALELLGKKLGLFTDKVEHSGSMDLAMAIAEGRKRASKF